MKQAQGIADSCGRKVPKPIRADKFIGPAMEAARIGVWQLDMCTGLGTWDAISSEILGRAPVAQSEPAPLPIHPDDRADVAFRLSRNVQGVGEQYVEVRIVTPDGETKWVRSTARPPRAGSDGRWVSGLLMDVTDRKLAQMQSEETRRQLETLIDNLPGIAYRCGAEPPYRVIFISDGAEPLTGYPASVWLAGGLTWMDIVCPDDAQELIESVETALQNSEQFQVTYRIKHASGELRWMSERGRRVADPDGSTWIEGFIWDITEERTLQQELLETKAQASEILDSIPHIIWSVNINGDCDYLSPQWYEFTGDRPCGSLNKLWLEAVHAEDVERVATTWKASFKSGNDFSCEYRLKHKDGTYRWVSDNGRLIEAGTTQRWYGTCTDVHERHAAMQALDQSESVKRSILESSPDCIKLLKTDGTICFVNALGGKALDIEDTAPLHGRCWFDLLSPEVAAAARGAVENAAAGHLAHFTAMQPTVTGRSKWFDIIVAPVDSDGEISQVVAIARDITDRKIIEEDLRQSELLHRSVLEASADCIKILSLGGKIEVMNTPGATSMELDDVDIAIGRRWADLWPEEMRSSVESAIEDAGNGNVARFTGLCPTTKGTAKWWDVLVTPMGDNSGTPTRLLAISRDVTASRQGAELLRYASEHDALTDLPNRRSFQAHLQAATIRAMESGSMVGLLLLDLDHFKHINDSLGHIAGDHLLKTFAKRLRSSLRGRDFVARLGGDEFAVVIEDVQSEQDLLSAGESILRRINTPLRLEGRALSTGASIGGAIFPRDAVTANELFKNADTALYALKEAGRGGTKMFHHHMREQAQRVASQLSLARVAISDRSITPFYQPKVCVRTGEIVGFEALLRWHHPTRGLQLPDTIAEAFADCELATKIGELMQANVIRDMSRWLRDGVNFGRISLNAAPAEFLRDDYAERLLELLRVSGVPTDLLEVEVTEHVFFERGSALVSRALRTLDEAGVRIALDDFGTGYSSLSHLRDFPVDVVKIDRSFVSQMTSQPAIASIVSAVIDLSRSLGIDVVAEGVETEEQQQMLVAKGCSFAQGYLFGRAMEGGELPILVVPKRSAA